MPMHLQSHLRRTIPAHRQSDIRPTACKRGYDRSWREARKVYLAQHPLCAIHAARGEVVGAVLIDHVIPHKGNYNLFWKEDNWQSLCLSCHNYKTARGQ